MVLTGNFLFLIGRANSHKGQQCNYWKKRSPKRDHKAIWQTEGGGGMFMMKVRAMEKWKDGGGQKSAMGKRGKRKIRVKKGEKWDAFVGTEGEGLSIGGWIKHLIGGGVEGPRQGAWYLWWGGSLFLRDRVCVGRGVEGRCRGRL